MRKLSARRNNWFKILGNILASSLPSYGYCRHGQVTGPINRRNGHRRLSASGQPDSAATCGGWSDVAAFDLFRQRLHHIRDVLEMRIDRQRLAVGFERILVVA